MIKNVKIIKNETTLIAYVIAKHQDVLLVDIAKEQKRKMKHISNDQNYHKCIKF